MLAAPRNPNAVYFDAAFRFPMRDTSAPVGRGYGSSHNSLVVLPTLGVARLAMPTGSEARTQRLAAGQLAQVDIDRMKSDKNGESSNLGTLTC